MDWRKSVGVAVGAAALTVILLQCWPALQQSIGRAIPEWGYGLTCEIARIGLFCSIGVMLQGLVPNMNRFRIGLYFLGTSGFLINLLGDDNAGNVFLEAGLTIQMAWSLVANWHKHEPMSRDIRAWMRGLMVMAVAYAIGLLVTAMWPVNAGNEWGGDWWGWLALAGGICLFVEVNLLETGVLKGDTPFYIFVHGVGCGLLTASYLGQYNAAGITLNVALFVIAIYSFFKASWKKS